MDTKVQKKVFYNKFSQSSVSYSTYVKECSVVLLCNQQVQILLWLSRIRTVQNSVLHMPTQFYYLKFIIWWLSRKAMFVHFSGQFKAKARSIRSLTRLPGHNGCQLPSPTNNADERFSSHLIHKLTTPPCYYHRQGRTWILRASGAETFIFRGF
jgi:hypothetical protein